MLKKFKQFIARHFSSDRHLGKPDFVFLITLGLIVVFGLVMLFSASTIVAYMAYHDAYYFVTRQLLWLAIGGAVFYFLYNFDYHRWRKYAFSMLVASLGLLSLIMVHPITRVVNGHRSWINLGIFSFQPSEFVKVTLIIYLAALLESSGKAKSLDIERAKKFFIVIGVIAALMLLQPDIGTLAIIMAACLILYFVNGGQMKTLLVCAAMALAMLAGYIGYRSLKGGGQSYMAYRFTCLYNPSSSASDKCYQINQSLLAVGSGGWFGRGIGNSRQKFLFLPEVQNDFIFAIIAEEVGWIFSSLLLGAFVLLIYRGILIAKRAPDSFGRNLAIGLVSWIGVQVIVNIGGIINLFPMTGVPLPLVSAGGTALLAALSSAGIIANISRQGK